MTCIAGYIDNGITYLGGDSLASCYGRGQTLLEKKVFKLNDISSAVLGFSGSVRDLNLLKYAENLLDKRDEPEIDHKYIVTKFIPNVMKLFTNNSRNENDKGISGFESYFLLGYKDKLWLIEPNYAVVSNTDKYQAIGSGTEYALGSLYTTENSDLSAIEKIHKALQAASKFCTGVAPPFYIVNTANDEVIKFED